MIKENETVAELKNAYDRVKLAREARRKADAELTSAEAQFKLLYNRASPAAAKRFVSDAWGSYLELGPKPGSGS